LLSWSVFIGGRKALECEEKIHIFQAWKTLIHHWGGVHTKIVLFKQKRSFALLYSFCNLPSRARTQASIGNMLVWVVR
jgi:hypothetical protein